ncbi:MAG: para-aminobenzoate synthase component II [Candidatus Saganbacteria bacterium]|uniref:Para-aminobenzoate synthase component II n=1 Tax=Candidatus Saganbacteria bacterium TaxID=2575572 RepID=A0A833L263_UNCSA|nr:MAG: para-aminobenzoate synthase component II [Candidatus Saganbacteria bacterium]
MLALFEFEKKPICFKNPEKIISCNKLDSVVGCFEEMEKAVSSGYYLAGFLSYESGFAFEPGLFNNKTYSFPLVYFGVFKTPAGGQPSLRVVEDACLPDRQVSSSTTPQYEFRGKGYNLSRTDYFKNINTIRSYIREGETYQITYCIKYKYDFTGSPFALYKELLKTQPVPYPAYIGTKDFTISSLSPEMFIKKNKDRVITKPMKGTWPKGLFSKWLLHFDQKNRAENIMIADLLRNDLGKIAKSGTVAAPKLFETACYTTLCQMTSTVCASIDPEIKFYALFKAVFPSGSVTGAPKIRSMEIINEIEKEERDIYTGAIGYITPQRDLFFNVPIRTLLTRGGKGEMGIGGGITWYSTPEGEYNECLTKTKFLAGKFPHALDISEHN